MIEILQVISHFFLFVFITFFPINTYTAPKIAKIFNYSYFNIIFVNSSILMLVLLILSFFRLNLNYIFFIIFFLYIGIFLYIFSDILKKFSLKNSYLKILFFIICISLFLNTANNLEIGWDGLSIWLFKANNFYNGNNFSDLILNEVPYIQYPHLGAYLWAFFWKNSFLQIEYLGRLFHLYIYITSIFILAETLKDSSRFKKLFFIFFIIIFSYDYDNTMGGYQEFLIFAMLIFSAKILELILNENNYQNFNVLSVFLLINTLLLSWIKNEALFYGIFIILIYLIINRFNKKALGFFIVGLLMITFQIIIKKYFFDLEKAFLFSLSPESLVKNINFTELFNRIYYTSIYMVHAILKYPINIINILSLIIFLKYFRKIKEYKHYLIFFLLNIMFLYGVYLVTDAPLIWHLKTSIERLILQTSGFYIFILLHLINKKIIKF